jgi:type 1 glutamine amidotransferase
VAEDPAVLATDDLSRRRAIVLHFMNWEKPDPGPAAREALRKAVDAGAGLVLVHFSCGAFKDWPEFPALAGRVYDPKLPPHDPYGPFRVAIGMPDHPALRGLAPFETADELYTCLAGDRPIEVLATAHSRVTGKDVPMAFVHLYGKGRVFHSPLGHDAAALSRPGEGELFRRGCAWAAGLEPLPPGPVD